jgi:hypothetical protein
MGDAATVAAFTPWLWIAVVIIICELSKALHKAKKQLAATKADLAGATASNARLRADRDDADAALRRALSFEEHRKTAPQQHDEMGRPFTLSSWQPPGRPS